MQNVDLDEAIKPKYHDVSWKDGDITRLGRKLLAELHRRPHGASFPPLSRQLLCTIRTYTAARGTNLALTSSRFRLVCTK
ncbi:unnamed protein product [Leptosia nina]|uniref:Uncharacterized protein n=1 Tax=Leptosia nina TaxID=320188 RepID=A0AAV1K675_9NEOP